MANPIKSQDNHLEIIKSNGNVFADLNLQDAERYQAKAELALQTKYYFAKPWLKTKRGF